ncbi:hypothetical protein L4C34_17100 [Vibrio profundum]
MLTDLGKTLLEKTAEPEMVIAQRMVEGMDEDEIKVMAKLMSKVADNFA